MSIGRDAFADSGPAGFPSGRDAAVSNRARLAPVDPTTIAVLSDVHGNRRALEAVLDDACANDVDLLIDLGDLVYGPLDPGATIDTLRSAGLPIVRVLGNEDRVIWETGGAEANHPSLEHTRAGLTGEQLDWLRHAPREATWQRTYLCHGCPRHDDRYLLEAVDADGLRAANATEVRTLLTGIEADLVLCGHSHVPRIVTLDDGRTVVNPGSVGLQAYADTLPFPHVVANGDPLARYALLTEMNGRWAPTLRAVRYDSHAAARDARRHGRPDWARALETGLA